MKKKNRPRGRADFKAAVERVKDQAGESGLLERLAAGADPRVRAWLLRLFGGGDRDQSAAAREK